MDDFNRLENLYRIESYNSCPETRLTSTTIFGNYNIKETWCIEYNLDTKQTGCYNEYSGFVTLKNPNRQEYKNFVVSERQFGRTLVRCLTVEESTVYKDFITLAIIVLVLSLILNIKKRRIQ